MLMALLCLGGVGYAGCHGQPGQSARQTAWADSSQHPVEVSFVFTGDIMQHDSQIADARLADSTRYDYGYCFSLLKPYLEAADFTVGNLELTFGGKPYRGYPAFSAPDTLAYTLKDIGYDVLVTANNHCLDRGQKGLTRTIQVLDSAQLLHLGTYLDSAAHMAETPLILQKDTIRIALLAYTYGANGIKNRGPGVVNYIDTARMAKDLAVARSQAHAIIVAMHWGTEYQPYPTSQQVALNAWLWQQGATVVLGNHPHVLQPIEVATDSAGYVEHLTMYALGNFVSAQRPYPRAGGMVLRCNLIFAGARPHIAAAEYLLTYTERPTGQPRPRYRVVPLWNKAADTLTHDRPAYVRRLLEDAEFLLRDVEPMITPLHGGNAHPVDSLQVSDTEGGRWRFQRPQD